MPTFDGSSTSREKYWRKELDAFFQVHPVAEREVVEIAALHLEGEVEDWWLSHIKHARVMLMQISLKG